MDIQLRDAVPADSPFVFNVFREAFHDYLVMLDGEWDEAHEFKRHLERFAHHRSRIVVAGATEVGYLATAIYREQTGTYPPSVYLHQLMILPSHQSRGIGAACLRLLSTEARALDMPVRFRVLRINPRALAFYRAAGCEVVGESETHFSLQLGQSAALA